MTSKRVFILLPVLFLLVQQCAAQCVTGGSFCPSGLAQGSVQLPCPAGMADGALVFAGITTTPSLLRAECC